MFYFVHIWLLSLLICVCAIDLLKEARAGIGTMITRQKQDYFVHMNTRHMFPDRFTTIAYGFLIVPETNVNFDDLTDGEAITSMWQPDVSNQLLLDRLRDRKHKELIMESVVVLPAQTNVAILYRSTQKDWLVQFALKNKASHFRVAYVPPSKANTSALGEGLGAATQWIAQNFNDWSSTKPSVPFIDVYGSDCKLLGMDDNKHVMLTFTRPRHAGARSVTLFAELFVRPKSSDPTSEINLVIEDIIDATLDIPNYPLINELDQINWVPFEYEKELLYIPYLWPLTVVSLTIDKRKSVWHAYATLYNNETSFVRDTAVARNIHVLAGGMTITGTDSAIQTAAGGVVTNPSQSSFVCPWKLGRPRGSTPAVLMPNGEYLGVFHAYDQLHRDQITSTYMIGAYTFKAVSEVIQGNTSVTFIMTAMSSQPIIAAHMYTGPWYTNSDLFGFIDYVVNPVSLLIEDEYVYIGYSLQMTNNYMAKLRLADLLASLEPVVKS